MYRIIILKITRIIVLGIVCVIPLYYLLMRITGLPVILPVLTLNNISNASVVLDVHSSCYCSGVTDTDLFVLYDNRTLYTYRGICKAECHEEITDNGYMKYIFRARKQIISKDRYNYIIDCCENLKSKSDLNYLYKNYSAADAKCFNIKYNGELLAEPNTPGKPFSDDDYLNEIASVMQSVSANYPCDMLTVFFVWDVENNKIISENEMIFDIPYSQK